MSFRRWLAALAALAFAAYLNFALPVFRTGIMPAVREALSENQLVFRLPEAASWLVSD